MCCTSRAPAQALDTVRFKETDPLHCVLSNFRHLLHLSVFTALSHAKRSCHTYKVIAGTSTLSFTKVTQPAELTLKCC